MPLVRFRHRGAILEGEAVDERTVRTPNGSTVAVARVEVLTPCAPTKILCTERNYEPDADAMLEHPTQPAFCLKPASAVVPSGRPIEYPTYTRHLQFGGQVAIVIGKRCKHVRAYDVDDVVLGYTALNDVTAVDVAREEARWTRAKSFDTSAPLGPWIETSADLADVRVRTVVNGELRQDASTRDLIFRVPHLVAAASRIMTLEPGDVVGVGTPPGVGELEPGDTVEVHVGELAPLVNEVVVADDTQQLG